MGLAASQGRFLLLTSRQSDVEMRMQSLTNQRLAIMRKSADLANQHLAKSNAQKVMWVLGAESAQETKPLEYKDIMSVSSNGITDTSFFLSNAYGAVMLDNSMYNRRFCLYNS